MYRAMLFATIVCLLNSCTQQRTLELNSYDDSDEDTVVVEVPILN